ncbi:hypothetical protein FRUB_09287 [Fimbriiglobus ruber]|uniref:Uncharacterized protein n=1 Tax=Fimbriiglobus ruber TaxID=1908690 RepID=A0A225DAN6_9BACT|nr:hypothetical protein FRUB_09287 [Fimbriiglobus ruber]
MAGNAPAQADKPPPAADAAAKEKVAKVTVDSVTKEWTARQEKVKTAVFECKIERTWHKGSFDAEPLPYWKKDQHTPPEDLKRTGISRVVFGGQKFRFDDHIPRWDPGTVGTYDSKHVDTYDGQLAKMLSDPTNSRQKYPTGRVEKSEASFAAKFIGLEPYFLSFRGDHPQHSHRLNLYKPTGRSSVIAGRTCAELSREVPANQNQYLLYVDVDRFVVVKKVTLNKRHTEPTWQIDISYSPDAVIGWVPQTWEYRIRTGLENKVSESGRTLVTKYQINPDVPKEEFDIAFPPGTYVVDKSSDKAVEYVIRW